MWSFDITHRMPDYHQDGTFGQERTSKGFWPHFLAAKAVSQYGIDSNRQNIHTQRLYIASWKLCWSAELLLSWMLESILLSILAFFSVIGDAISFPGGD